MYIHLIFYSLELFSHLFIFIHFIISLLFSFSLYLCFFLSLPMFFSAAVGSHSQTPNYASNTGSSEKWCNFKRVNHESIGINDTYCNCCSNFPSSASTFDVVFVTDMLFATIIVCFIQNTILPHKLVRSYLSDT